MASATLDWIKMTIHSEKLTSGECDFLHAFSDYRWGTIKNDSSVFITGPLTQDQSLTLAKKINKIWAESKESKKRTCYTFKGPIASENTNHRYYVTVSRNTLSLPSISTSSSSNQIAPAVAKTSVSKQETPPHLVKDLLAEHPVIWLNQKSRSSQKPLDLKLQENFDKAQSAEDGDSSFFHEMPELDSECTIVYHPPKDDMLHAIGVASFNGSVPYMEDHHRLDILRFSFENTEYAIPYYSIFDGHSCTKDQNGYPTKRLGYRFAETVSLELRNLIHQSLHSIMTNPLLQSTQKQTEEVYNQIKLAFTKASRIAHQQLSGPSYPDAGTTATVAFFLNDALWVACAGDSSAILSTPKEFIALSIDSYLKLPTDLPKASEKKWCFYPEKAADIPLESRTIYNRGPYIFRNAGNTVRAASGLEISRSLGHAEIPKGPNPAGINPRPTLIRHPMKMYAANNNFLILATDGLWKKAKPKDVSEVVQKLAKQGMRCDAIAKELVDRAWSCEDLDNITVIIINLEQPKSS